MDSHEAQRARTGRKAAALVLGGLAALALIPVGAILQLSGDGGDAGSVVWTLTVFLVVGMAIAGALTRNHRLGRALLVLGALGFVGGSVASFVVAWG